MFHINGDDSNMKKNNEKCPACEKGNLQSSKVPYSVYGVQLGVFPAKVCSSCDEQWFDKNTSEKIQALEKEKGLWGLSKKTKISYSGNSLVIRIPEQIARYLNLKKEEEVTLHPEGKNKLILEI